MVKWPEVCTLLRACMVSWNRAMPGLCVMRLTMLCAVRYRELSWLLMSRRRHRGLWPKPSRRGLALGAGLMAGLKGL